MGYNALFFAYCLRFARKHEVYDYRSYNNAFYGKFAPVFSNLFEILYICVMCVAPAVAFATGGATLSTLTGLPYLLCTLIIGIFIFVVAVFGTDLVRKVASVLSVCIIAGLLIVYIPNIIAGAGQIADTASRMTANGGSLGKHSIQHLFTEHSSWQMWLFLCSMPRALKSRMTRCKVWESDGSSMHL